MSRIELLQNFMRFVRVLPDGSWEWIGYIHPSGCPRWITGKRNGYSMVASRAIYQLLEIPIPEGYGALHFEGKPKHYVRPNFDTRLGSHQENMDDRTRFGRSVGRVGESHHHKLKESQVLRILDDLRPQSQIAKELGVSQSLVSRIKVRKSWTHLHHES